jgi:hypothetical protein
LKRLEYNRDLIRGDEERANLPKGLISKMDRVTKHINKLKQFSGDSGAMKSVIEESKELSLRQFMDEII